MTAPFVDKHRAVHPLKPVSKKPRPALKQVYPYLRYGVVISEEATVPGRLFTHNKALDFCAAIADYKGNRLSEILAALLKAEVDSSRRLEEIGFGKLRTHLFRTEVVLATGGSKVK